MSHRANHQWRINGHRYATFALLAPSAGGDLALLSNVPGTPAEMASYFMDVYVLKLANPVSEWGGIVTLGIFQRGATGASHSMLQVSLASFGAQSFLPHTACPEGRVEYRGLIAGIQKACLLFCPIIVPVETLARFRPVKQVVA